MAYRVFLSHAAKDIQIADMVMEKALSIGVEVYLCEHDVQPGTYIADKIKAEINRSDCLIVLLTENSQSSSYVQQEIGFMEGLKKPIVPLVFPGFNKKYLAMLEGQEYVYFDLNQPEIALNSLLEFLQRKKIEKEIAQGVFIIGGLFLVGALLFKK